MEKLIEKLGDHFIGLWTYRLAHRKKRTWAVTIHFHGNYYDVIEKKTPEEAIKEAIRTLKKLQAVHKKRKRNYPLSSKRTKWFTS